MSEDEPSKPCCVSCAESAPTATAGLGPAGPALRSAAAGRVLPLTWLQTLHRSHLKLFSHVHIMQVQVRLAPCSLPASSLPGAS